ncbi:SDR family oxidoreductase [Halotalea alkalilenta]|uniref:SDR family oxidoreductase n=1 Tax=Halotalea alkalilenta TaxID=376489 RepID=UPI000489BCAE|nr:SDR family oxidoreductase [Halotalea alkalilenta]
MTDHRSRVALITGANKGIGFETARRIGRHGHVVLLGARDPARGEAAATTLKEEGIDAHFVHLDVTNRATILAAARDIERRFGRLDILVNNAGVSSPLDGPLGKADLAEVRRLFETNFFGTLEVTQALLPLLKKAPSARIVNVSSGLGSLARNSDPDWEYGAVQLTGYNSAKAALNMATILLAKELKSASIKVNSVAPGFTATDLNGGGPGAQTVEEGAEASVLAALLPDDGTTGGFLGRQEPEPW